MATLKNYSVKLISKHSDCRVVTTLNSFAPCAGQAIEQVVQMVKPQPFFSVVCRRVG